MTDERPPTPESEHAERRVIEAPRFSLRSLLLGVGLLSALFAVMSALGAVYSVLLVWVVLLVAAHVVGNAWGTRLREGRVETNADSPGLPVRTATAAMARSARAPTTRLGGRIGIDRYMVVATCAGAVSGAVLGTLVFSRIYGHTAGLSAILFGAFSAAVLGGFLGFLVSSFLGVALQALREASNEPKS